MFRRSVLPAFVLLAIACDANERAASGSDSASPESRERLQAMPAPAPAAPPVDMAATSDGSAQIGKQSYAISTSPARVEVSSAQMSAQPVDLLVQSMIVRTGSASIKVDSLALGMARVRSLATRVGGYIGNTQVDAANGNAPSATLELRVPSARFDEAIAGIEAIGTTEGVQVSAEDVGEQYMDLEARIANSRRMEQRLIELLASRTGRLSDVLQVEEKLSQTRSEIERMEGRMRWLRTRASVSTISVTVHEPYPVVSPSGTPSVLAEALRRAWRNFVSLIAAVIAASGVLVPIAGVVVAGWALWRRHYRRPAVA